MIEEKEFQLTGNVSYSVKMRYKWLTEPGACKVCKAMHGKLYDKDKVPKKPHPNCKCRVEEISVIDPQISKQYEFKEEFILLEMDAMKLLGDINFANNNLEKYVKSPNNKEIQKEKEHLSKEADYLENQINKTIDELNSHPVIININYIRAMARIIQEIRQQVSQLNKKVDELRVKNDKAWLDATVEKHKGLGEDAAALWKLASSRFKEGMDYVEKNGYMINKVSDLNDEMLEKKVRDKLESQHLNTESRGIILNESSSLADSVLFSREFDKFIENNLYELAMNEKLPDKTLKFGFLDSSTNNSLALHFCDVVDIYIDRKNILHAKIIDTVDYNSDEWWVKIPHEVQENNMLENYYVIIKVAFPLDHWINR